MLGSRHTLPHLTDLNQKAYINVALCPNLDFLQIHSIHAVRLGTELLRRTNTTMSKRSIITMLNIYIPFLHTWFIYTYEAFHLFTSDQNYLPHYLKSIKKCLQSARKKGKKKKKKCKVKRKVINLQEKVTVITHAASWWRWFIYKIKKLIEIRRQNFLTAGETHKAISYPDLLQTYKRGSLIVLCSQQRRL